MKVVALGGSAAGPNTGTGCSGFLVMAADTSLVLDLGPGTLPELRKHVDYRRLGAVLISHYHLDHILDVAALRFLAAYNPVPLERKIALWVPPGSLERFGRWAAVFKESSEAEFLESVFDLSEYNHAQPLTIGSLEISLARTVHPEPAWAMRVSGAGKGDFGYTADTGPTADLAGFFAGVSLLAAESTESSASGIPAAKRGHLNPIEAGRLAADAGARMLLLTHRWEELDLDRAAREAGAAFSGPILTARPGLTVFV